MNSGRLICLYLLCVASTVPLCGASAETSEIDKAREVFAKNKDAVVTIRLVLKEGFSSTMGSEQSESTSEATGVVIGADGLAVMSLSEADPSGSWNDVLGESGDEFQFEYSTQVSDLKIMREGGKEIPAQIVLRDKDLDLAFLKPIEPPEKPFAFIDLSDKREPEILERLVVLDRMSRVADRVPHVCLAWLEGVITKPRTYYVADRGGLGAPVFTLDGKVVGLILSFDDLYDEDSDLFYSIPAEGLLLPSAEIIEIANHARQATGPDTASTEGESPAPEAPATE